MRKEKQLLLDEVKSQFGQYPAFLVVRYKSLTANSANAFRTEIANLGGNFEVLSRRMLHRAAGAAGVDLDLAALQGHVGIVFTGADALATTKSVIKFGKDNNKSVEVMFAQIEERLYPAEDVVKLANLPSKDEMRAQFLATLEAPMAHTLGTMEALLTCVMYCLEEKSKQ